MDLSQKLAKVRHTHTGSAAPHRRVRYISVTAVLLAALGLICGVVAAAASPVGPGSGGHRDHRSAHFRDHRSAHFRAAFHRYPPGAAGTVASVGGSSASGTCGTAGSTGTFTLTTFRGDTTVTVDVTSTTTFSELGTPSASFADVCVGSEVFVLGSSVSSTTTTSDPTTIDATKVFIAPPPTLTRAATAAGTVASVGGSSSTGTCGTAGASGTFTLTSFKGGATVTVDVTSTTTFFEPGVSSASFADVCVGSQVFVLGSSASTTSSSSTTPGPTTIDATKVFIVPTPPQGSYPHPGGTNSSTPGGGYGGSTGPSTPGEVGSFHGDPSGGPLPPTTTTTPAQPSTVTGTVTAKSLSSFAISVGGTGETVQVAGTTSYAGPQGVSSFAAIAVGDVVRADGMTAGGLFTADSVTVLVPVGAAPGATGAPSPPAYSPPSPSPAPWAPTPAPSVPPAPQQPSSSSPQQPSWSNGNSGDASGGGGSGGAASPPFPQAPQQAQSGWGR
jgi:hypothetical protein